jgi:outer membrane protein assembly factor BamB
MASQTSAPSTASRLPGDYPQFLGKNRNGIVDAISLQTNWTVQPPQLLWRQPVGGAWSGFSVVGDRAVTQEQSGDDELVVCRDVIIGNVIW